MTDPDPIPVPDPESDWPTIWHFALTYNGYSRRGAFDQVAEVGNSHRDGWMNSRSMSDNLEELRTVLFFEQRRYRHSDSTPSGDAAQYVRKLVSRIAQLSGGAVTGPVDDLP